jgi:excisionase family DNA binding protein
MPKTQNAAKRPITLDELASGNRTVITIEEAAGALRLKRTATYEAVRRGQLPSLRLGRRLFVPVPALLRLLNGESAEASAVEAIVNNRAERPPNGHPTASWTPGRGCLHV